MAIGKDSKYGSGFDAHTDLSKYDTGGAKGEDHSPSMANSESCNYGPQGQLKQQKG